MLTSSIVKVLFFSPFSNIWAHSFPEALIAEGLIKQGVEVTTIRCGGMLDLHCVAERDFAVALWRAWQSLRLIRFPDTHSSPGTGD